jgi:hypothetical protein
LDAECQPPSGSCQDEIDAYTSCQDGCGWSSCSGAGTECSCEGSCFNEAARSECVFVDDYFACDCFLDGDLVASCETDSVLNCVSQGFACCADVFPEFVE